MCLYFKIPVLHLNTETLKRMSNTLLNVPDVKYASDAPAKEVAAGRRGDAACTGRDVARGGVHAGVRAAGGGAPHVRGVGEASGQPSAVPGQSASQGEFYYANYIIWR